MLSKNKRKIGILAVLLVGGISYLVFPAVKILVTQVVNTVKSISEERNGIADAIRQEIFSSPLLSDADDIDGSLDSQIVVNLTNGERLEMGLPNLKFNSKLEAAAKMKIDDMFSRQYFEHVSPDGHGPGYLADQAGYDYVVVGENLALGNFKNNEALVAAWMASPGHKENILNSRYQEIGVAVQKGTYQGKTVWLAVQEFGKPLSDCPRTDPALKIDIDGLRAKTDMISTDLAGRRLQLESMSRGTPEQDTAYNAKVSEYNARVADYDLINNELQVKIDWYNTQVRAFNACIKQ